MADRPRRWFRPGAGVQVGSEVWVVDDVQPVAVVLDAESGSPLRTVGWSQLPPPATDDDGWLVQPAERGLWVQRSRGPLLLVGDDGSVQGRRSGGQTLGVVTQHGAWCIPDRPVQDLAMTEDAPPPAQGGQHRLLVSHPDRVTAEVIVDAPVYSAQSIDAALWLEVGTGGGTRRDLGTSTCWEFVAETAWLRLPPTEPPPGRLSMSTHSADSPPRRVPDGFGVGRSRSLWVPALDSAGRRPPDITASAPGELDWWVGWVGQGSGRRAQARGVDAGTPARREYVDLGDGTVRAVLAAGGWLWIAIEARRDYSTSSRPAPVALLRVRADTGDVETVLAPDSVDVTGQCWPLPAPPLDVDDWVQFWLGRFADLDRYWTRADGSTSPLAAGLSRSRVDVVGDWPDTCFHITFDHTSCPGRRLRRVVPLFDELGRPAFLDYVPIHLMETLDTGGVDEAMSDRDPIDV